MKRFRAVLENIITSGGVLNRRGINDDESDALRIVLLNCMFLTVFFACLVFFYVHIKEGEYIRIFFNVAFLLVSAFFFLKMRQGCQIDMAARWMTLFSLIYIFSISIKGIVDNPGLMFWYYVFPPIAMFLIGGLEGLFWSFASFIMYMLFILFPEVEYQLKFVIRAGTTHLMGIMFIYFFEYSRRKVRKELKKSNEQKDLMRQRVFTSAKMATLGEMAGNIAHEINGPLLVIYGNAKILKRRMVESDSGDLKLIEKYIEKIMSTTERISSIVKGLKISSRNSENDEFRLIKVSRIVNEAISLCREKMEFNRIDIIVEDNAGDPVISCRETEILQVLMNLIINSYDEIIDLSERWIKIVTEIGTDSIDICVSDSGHGIPEENHGPIFKPFFSTKSVNEGTGLGLGISKKIVVKHGGELFLDSRCDDTTFVIRLPRELH